MRQGKTREEIGRKGMKQRKRGLIWGCVVFAIAAVLFLGFHWKVTLTIQDFTESSAAISNPNRGFYYIYGFRIRDEKQDYVQQLSDKMKEDTDTTLAMVQINLQEYRDGAISEAGLANIEALFEALEGVDKQMILRFLYDWNGENEVYEPQSITIIQNHMKQLKEVFLAHEKKIFVLQGLFVGNWGELNGTRYSDDASLQTLAKQLMDVTGQSTFLAVRTPAQWRKITQTADASWEESRNNPTAYRLSLFNDGMLGNESDYGTYGTKNREAAGDFSSWTRKEELAFQEELCRYVPNGGEVINANEWNDLEHAREDLSVMHVTYLNRDYDRKVLEKWEQTKVSNSDCFDGMDGLSYIERHLGYRLLITDNQMEYDIWKDRLNLAVTMKNVGFAPLYKDCRAVAALYQEDTCVASTELTQQLKELAGRSDVDAVQTLNAEISLRGLREKQYQVYFYLEDVATGKRIALANEQKETPKGYFLGMVELE